MTSNKCAPNHNIGLSHATRDGGESRARHARGQVQKGDSEATCMQIKGPPPTSFQAKHNPTPSLSIRPPALSFSGLNKKLFSSPVPCPFLLLPFHSERTHSKRCFPRHILHGAHARVQRVPDQMSVPRRSRVTRGEIERIHPPLPSPLLLHFSDPVTKTLFVPMPLHPNTLRFG